jgi:hypothetical protein
VGCDTVGYEYKREIEISETNLLILWYSGRDMCCATVCVK